MYMCVLFKTINVKNKENIKIYKGKRTSNI